ncbi:hypothetical protein [Streptomyces sp. NPDC088752]|uniref:hypothetical protein n=1 Tax=Streptomyces sp. NPDC088752 TaxID=3154963 RepID=UPI00139425FB|nr:hypothetical protein [Streptomyces sp. SID2131]
MTATALVALTATACSSGDSGSRVEGLCGPAADSAAGKSLREVLGTDDFTAEALTPDDRFAERFKQDLEEWGGGPNSTSPSFLCRFVPEDSKNHVLLGFAWSPADQPGKERARGGTVYDVSGATGTAVPLATELFAPCELGGELSGPSRKAVLRADATLTVDRGRDTDRQRETSELSFLYLMTREAAKVLGCENHPLADDPVVKPLTGSTP